MTFTEIRSRIYHRFKAARFGRSSIDTRYALLEACLIGILSALAALLLKKGIGWLGGWRLQAAEAWGAWWVLPTVGMILGWLSGWLIEQYSPSAAGGGISQVKAALARHAIPLSLQVAFQKLLGTILVLGAGLTLGRRAPTVHIGAALAAQLSEWLPTSPDHRRQMIAAGAAAGLAAGFTTPIAGVLFVIEELMREASGLTLETAIVASFTGAVVSLLLQSADLNFPPSLQSLPDISFSIPEIPFYLFLGVLAGVLGGIFNRGMLFSVKVNRQLSWPLSWRVGFVGLVSGMIIALLPPFFRDNAGLREFLVTGELNWHQLGIAFVAHFFLTMLAYSSGAPGGLFAPALVLGSALGYLVGDLEEFITGTGAEATYALAGMGAFFTAVVRVPVTAIVIVFELTANFNIVLPLMATCAVSYIVAESVSAGSLYQHLLQARGIFLTEEGNTQDVISHLRADDVMQSQVETLSADLTLEEVRKAMTRSHHRGFPVMEDGKLVGIVTQTDLANLTNLLGDLALRSFMTPNPITVRAEASLSDVLYLLNRYKLSRLPVTEEQKLIGIITRSDIIRVEATQLGGTSEEIRDPRLSYITYQTRAPATGQGRLLLPISNPDNAADMFQIAAGIAREKHYEIECLHIIKVPKHIPPNQVAVDELKGRKLLHRLERLGRQWQLPVHTQLRAAQDIPSAVLETIHDRHISLLILGWDPKSSVSGTIWGKGIELLVNKVTCDLMLVKLGTQIKYYPYSLDSSGAWLLPIAGGPNSQKAIAFLPGLFSLYARHHLPKLLLCQVDVSKPSGKNFNNKVSTELIESLSWKLHTAVMSVTVCSNSAAEAVIDVARAYQCEVVVLGASREGLIQQVIHGNIPDTIFRSVDSTVIVVKDANDENSS